ncbi:hypothetical protein BAGA_07215 [Bacillus gaemokensis]|uniref:Uncharacterized protein n=1 Tax=Bacillus gaemokensis TaxID=574375 RepID=A0A073KB35_9BACI|nr:hypothetical protein BAGA_07215 [Bacillus gaemokensis]
MKIPTGGDEQCFFVLSPRAVKAGFGVIPKPTVQSGWEKMEVQAFKKDKYLNVCLMCLKFSLCVIRKGFFSCHKQIGIAEPFHFP